MAYKQGTDDGLRELALFAGAGGGILGGKLLGWRTVCAVEIEPYPASVLVQRQNDGILPPFPIWDDVTTFDGRPWRGIVDVVSGGFPCQDISAAGKGAGITGARSGLWKEMARIIGEVRPRFCFVENSPMLTLRGLGTVLGDLSEMGYDARWGVFSGYDLEGSPQIRSRLFVLARLHCDGVESGIVHNGTDAEGGYKWPCESPCIPVKMLGVSYGSVPAFDGMDHGLADRVDEIRAIGNGQVPPLVELAWKILSGS